MSSAANPLHDRFLSWFTARMPGVTDLRLSDLRKPGAGMSSDTQLFHLRWSADDGDHDLEGVLRCAPRGDAPFPEYDLGLQFGIMRALGEGTAVRVPEVLWLEEDAGFLGVPFLVMRAVEGRAPLDFPSYQAEGFYADASPEQRRHLWRSTVEQLARLHEASWEALGLDFVPGGRPGEDPARHALGYWRRYLDDWIKDDPKEKIDVFDEALDWLERNLPEPERISLCWGDAKIGNVLYRRDTGDVAAVIDWELATIGDPEADLASLRVSDLRAQDTAEARCEGTPSESELIELYERASGRRVRHFHYQLVYSTFWRGSVALKVMRRMKAQGADIEDSMLENHFPVRYLRELLGGSSPRPAQPKA
jgi:aminoglycoside phosphotransferase (APT) family kinase protein